MFSGRTGWIGVDIGTHAVKVAQLVRESNRLRLRRAMVVQRIAPWRVDDGASMVAPESSGDLISAVIGSNQFFAGTRVACTLPMSACELRSLCIPPGTSEQRRSMIAGELANDWSTVPPMEFDYWELDPVPDGSGNENNVSVLATPRTWIEQLAGDCRRAGAHCWAVDGLPTTMARAVALVARPSQPERVLAIDWGCSNTTLAVVGEGRAFYTRRIRDCGMRLILDEVCDMLSVSHDQAQHLLHRIGVVGGAQQDAVDVDLQSALTEAASATMRRLVHEVNRTVNFLQTSRKHLMPQSICLFGGGAGIRNIAGFVQGPLDNLPVHVWQMPMGETPASEVELPSVVFGHAAALSALAWE